MRRIVLCAILAVACGTTSGDDGADAGAPDSGGNADAGDEPIVLRGKCADEERWGLFLVEAQDYSLVDGDVADGVVPAAIPELVEEEGECRLLRRRNPFCNPPCMAGQTCDHDGTCIAYPRKQNVGVVSISGLEKEIRMEPLATNEYFDTDVPHPIFLPGAEIRLTTTEGAYGTIALFGFGFDLLETDGSPWRVSRGQPLALSWTPPSTPVGSRIAFRLNIDQHGNSPLTLACDLEDDGAAEIPSSLIDALFASGVSGFPNGELTRETADKVATGAGCTELRISSPRRGMVEVVGHTPCTNNSQCRPPQTCDLPTNTCR